jgi:hypothetical protein
MSEGTTSTTGSEETAGTPVVVVERKRSRRRYSTGLKSVQVMERNLSRAFRRVARSLDEGMDAYQEARDESAERTRDGALMDFIPNVADGMSQMLEVLTPLPQDLAKALYPPRARRIVRNATRIVGAVYEENDVEDDEDEDYEYDEDVDDEDDY